jgi:ComF family protein
MGNYTSMAFGNALDAIVSVLFPGPCRVCRATLTNARRIPVCEDCLASFQRIEEPMCQCCGRPFVSAVAAQSIRPLCRLCRTNYFSFERARSWAIYDDELTSAVLLLKYEQVTRLGHWFASRLAEVASSQKDWKPDVVVPVPLHVDRQRERGYNQAELIARPLAKLLSLKFEPHMLVRTKPRPPRLILSRSERWASVRGAYSTRDALRVDNLRILLVDDVVTTGATLDACARALKRAGAAAVLGLTVGRVAAGWPSSGQLKSANQGNQKGAKSIKST